MVMLGFSFVELMVLWMVLLEDHEVYGLDAPSEAETTKAAVLFLVMSVVGLEAAANKLTRGEKVVIVVVVVVTASDSMAEKRGRSNMKGLQLYIGFVKA
jgi:hypothetical protein